MTDKLHQIVARALGIAADRVTDELAMQSTPEWDSLKHMEIIIGLETELAMELSFDEIAAMRSVGEIRRILVARGKL